jgi:hypothetical protein
MRERKILQKENDIKLRRGVYRVRMHDVMHANDEGARQVYDIGEVSWRENCRHYATERGGACKKGKHSIGIRGGGGGG